MSLFAAALLAGAALSACGSSSSSSSSSSSAGAAGTGAKSSGSASPIKVGFLFPTTGSMASLGANQEAGAKLVLQYANSHGGVDGHQFQMFEADSQSDPGTAATAAQRLIDQDHVQILIGSYGSNLAQAEVPVAARNHVLLWEVGAVAPTVNTGTNPYFLRTVGPSDTYATADLNFLQDFLAAKIGKPANQIRIAVAHENGPFGSSVASAIVSQAKAKGLNVVADIAYAETATDMTPVVLQVKQANPDVLLMTPLVSSAPLFWEAAKTQNLDLKAIIGSAGFGSSVFAQKFGSSGVEGVYDVEAPSVANMSTTNLVPEAKTVLQSVEASYQQQTGRPCLVHCGDGVGGAYILAYDVLAAAAKKGTLSNQAIRSVAAGIDLPTGSTPQGFGVKFNAEGDNVDAQSSIMQWQGGTLKVVYPNNIAIAAPEYPMPTWSQR